MRIRKVAVSLGMAVAFTGASATTAGAYDNSDLSIQSWEYNTGDCPCSNSSGLDYTGFKKDVGGEALKLVVKKNGTPVAQVEFHPSDELLYSTTARTTATRSTSGPSGGRASRRRRPTGRRGRPRNST